MSQVPTQALPQMSTRRVVITGVGLLCGIGNTATEVWRQLLAGTSGMGPIQAFDLEIPDENAEKIKTVKDAIDYIEKNAKGGK